MYFFKTYFQIICIFKQLKIRGKIDFNYHTYFYCNCQKVKSTYFKNKQKNAKNLLKINFSIYFLV